MPGDSWNLAPGLNNVGSFQVSGRPFVSGSCLAPASGSTSLVQPSGFKSSLLVALASLYASPLVKTGFTVKEVVQAPPAK